MFIDLKNGSCINESEILGANTLTNAQGYYVVKITTKNNLGKNAGMNGYIEVKFKDKNEANAYLEKYFQMGAVF